MADGFNYTVQSVEDLCTREFGWKGEMSQNGEFVCYCPIHGDKKASLHVALKNGYILIKCWSHGCEKQIYKDLSDRGAWPQQLDSRAEAEAENKRYEKKYPERAQTGYKWNSVPVSHREAEVQLKKVRDTIQVKSGGRGKPHMFHKTMVHLYTDGEFAHSIVVRYDCPGQSKRIFQYSYGWYDEHDEPNRPTDPLRPRWQIKGWSSEVKHMLYALTYIIAKPEATVVVVEGEKAADYGNTYIAHKYPDFVFTTWKGGAQAVESTDWGTLQGKRVIILPDADEAGIFAGKAVLEELSEITDHVTIVDTLALGLDEKWDIADYPSKEFKAPRFLDLIEGRWELHGETFTGLPENMTREMFNKKMGIKEREFKKAPEVGTGGKSIDTAKKTKKDKGPETSSDNQDPPNDPPEDPPEDPRQEPPKRKEVTGIDNRVVFRYQSDGSHRVDCIDYFNKGFGFLVEGGKANVVVIDNIKKNPESAVIPESVFHSLKANVRIQAVEGGTLKPATKYWLTNDCRKFDRASVVPHKPLMYEEDDKQVVNLWNGFAAETMDQSGSCEKFLKHLRYACSGESDPETLYDFLITFFARMVQTPQRRQGAILLFRGDQGSGKSIIGEYLRMMVGNQASLTVNKLDRLTGQFNSQLSGKILCRVEEAKIPRGEHYEALKDLSTNPFFTMEAKGKNQVTRENYVHFIFTGNYDYIAPVAEKERRLVPVDVPNDHTGNQEYFNGIVEEMENGGPAALFKYLKELDIPESFLPIPQSDALKTQKKHTRAFSGEATFLDWYSKTLKNKGLQSGINGPTFTPWMEGQEVDRATFWDSFNAWQIDNVRTAKFHTNRRFFYQYLEKFQSGSGRGGVAIKNDPYGRFHTRYSGTLLLTFPNIQDAREVFFEHVGGDESYDISSKEDSQIGIRIEEKERV